jgi:hypothetical protein
MIKRAAASKGVMGSVVGLGVGGASYFVAAKVGPKISFLQGRWWALPTALAVAGHVTKRWSPETGQAVVGAAGALMAFSYYVNASAAPSASTAAAKGLNPGEAGRIPDGAYGSAGALQMGPGRSSAGYTGAYTNSPYRRSDAGALVT